MLLVLHLIFKLKCLTINNISRRFKECSSSLRGVIEEWPFWLFIEGGTQKNTKVSWRNNGSTAYGISLSTFSTSTGGARWGLWLGGDWARRPQWISVRVYYFRRVCRCKSYLCANLYSSTYLSISHSSHVHSLSLVSGLMNYSLFPKTQRYHISLSDISH